MNAADLLRRAMAAGSVSKSRLSRSSGVSRSSIDDYLSGRREPSLSQLERLMTALGQRLTLETRPAGWTEFLAVLEFGALFPRRDPAPLPNMTAVWQGRHDPAAAA